MKFEELIVLLPCHSLEDFPVHQEGAQADSLLAAWSALWHPALLTAAGKLPTWHRADGPPSDLANRLVVIPPASETLLLAGWVNRAEAEGATVVRKFETREQILSAALAEPEGAAPPVDADLAADFLALGLCFLLVELLTRQMRYMSNVDEIHLRNETVAAARAAVEGDTATARDRLHRCFDVLTEARERFYPVEAYLVDLTLTAPTTLGAGLRRELADTTPKNLLISAGTLELMAQREPESLAALRQALEGGHVCLVGGERDEADLPLMPVEAVLGELRRGAETYRNLLGVAPLVFGRRRFGLTPFLPLVLSRLGFQGALHLALDDGHFPKSGQSKTRWEGLDSSAIDALGRLPLDANAPESILRLPRKMGESMDLDHVATVVFAHWPGQSNVYYHDLRRMARYAPALGKFVTLTEYFSGTSRPGELTRFKADQYRTAFLKQDAAGQRADPISRHARQHRLRVRAEAEQTLATLVELIGGTLPAGRADLTTQIVARHSDDRPDDTPDEDLAGRIESQVRTAAAAFATALSPKRGDIGYLVANPQSFPRRVGVDVSDLPLLPAIEGPVVAAEESGDVKRAVVEVPAMGFVWVGPAAERAKPVKLRSKPPNTLANEFLEVVVHATTGGIRSLRDPAQRGNRLSQQLALRLPGPRPKPGDLYRDPDEEAIYSVMAADSIEVTASGAALGEIVSRGRLLDRQGKRLAGYVQTVRLWSGSRVALVDIELDIDCQPAADPWASYYASRFAWGDEDAELWRSVSQTSQLTDARRLEAPHFVEIRAGKSRTAILTGGLPYHRRVGARMLDSLLVVNGETARRFKMAVGIDLAHPMQHAISLLDPPTVVPAVPRPASGASAAWLFQVDAKNVVATHWEAIRDGQRVAGFRVRLLECEGRGGLVRLRALRALESARQVDFRGEPLVDLPVEGEQATIDMAACEWVEVEARWRT
ncbi:MAG: hypothetical protein WD278_14540 [Pirellulales bacterium]